MKDKCHNIHQKENIGHDLSTRNNLMPIRTFGRDISNLQRESVLMQDRSLANPKANKKIKLKYPKNSESRRKFGYEISRQANPSAMKSNITSKRYITSSSLTDRNKKFKMTNHNTKNQLYKRKMPMFKEATSRVGMIKPITKSFKNRSMSRSQLGGKENRKTSLR